MDNFIYQGKLIRHFSLALRVYNMLPGGGLNYQNGSLITFFHSARRTR